MIMLTLWSRALIGILLSWGPLYPFCEFVFLLLGDLLMMVFLWEWLGLFVDVEVEVHFGDWTFWGVRLGDNELLLCWVRRAIRGFVECVGKTVCVNPTSLLRPTHQHQLLAPINKRRPLFPPLLILHPRDIPNGLTMSQPNLRLSSFAGF